MKSNTLTERTVRLSVSSRRSARNGSVLADELCAIPHVEYLSKFDRVEFDPALLGLRRIGMGFEPTLVAAPDWVMPWMRKVECLSDLSWDMPILSRTPFEVWSSMAQKPQELYVSPRFILDGGFVNYWSEEGREHLIWGHVDKTSAASIMAFVWLQNVMAGGRFWSRRELGNVSTQFQQALPIGYASLGDDARPVMVRTLGMRLPILQNNEARLENVREWIQMPRAWSLEEPILTGELSSLIIPESSLSPSTQAVEFSLGASQPAGYGVVWSRQAQLPAFMGFYPAGFNTKIDEYQENWGAWIRKAAPQLSQDKVMEVLLCMREAAINADKHGCQNGLGKRVFVSLINDAQKLMLKVRVSDPGKGHRHNLNSMQSRQDQLLGRHLGLMLIHGLSTTVRFSDEGATIEFDFSY